MGGLHVNYPCAQRKVELLTAFTDDEFQEWHEHIWKQRNCYKHVLENIVTGVPTISGMASGYRKLTLVEIVKMAQEALD